MARGQSADASPLTQGVPGASEQDPNGDEEHSGKLTCGAAAVGLGGRRLLDAVYPYGT